MAEICVTVDEAGHVHLNLTGSSTVEIRHSVELSGLQLTDAADSVLPPGLLDGARAPP